MSDIKDRGTLPPEAADTLWSTAEEMREPMVAFARRLIQTPSLPGEEGEVAHLVAREMEALGYDEVRVDEAGNVIGRIRPTAPLGAGGQGLGNWTRTQTPTPDPQPLTPREAKRRSIMFNTHMDHVDVGDLLRWPHPPYAATVLDGEIWGRGASDLKGPLAAQVYAGALLKKTSLSLANDVYVVGVVQEEIGGLGSMVLAENTRRHQGEGECESW